MNLRNWSALLATGGMIAVTGCANPTPSVPTNFNECVDAGGAIWETYPLECRMPDDTVFVQDMGFEVEPGSPRPEKTPR